MKTKKKAATKKRPVKEITVESELSKDGNTYTLRLKSNAPLTLDDVINGFNQVAARLVG